jgi:hypothetical protein
MGTRACSCVRVRSRAGADDALTRGSCASATRSLRKATHRWNTHIHSVVRPRAASVRLGARVPVRLGAYASAPTHASAFRRRRPRVARLAGVRRRVGVQRQHRRVGHRVIHRVERSMCRLFGRAARHRGRDKLGAVVDAARAVVRGGAADARALVFCADVWARACAGVPVCRYSCA